jgi:uncharacterized protein (TIGR02147 family)
MSDENPSVFEYLSFQAYLRDRFQKGPRGLQTQLAKAMGCQATYLIKVSREQASLTEDQAYSAGRFFAFNAQEMDYFLELVRYERAAVPESKAYFRGLIDQKARAVQKVKNRINSSPLERSLHAQLQYFVSPMPSLIHLATSCPHLQTPAEIAQWLGLEISAVEKVLKFLKTEGLVTLGDDDRYRYSGESMHLPKDSPLHAVFQKARREVALERLGRAGENDLNFSSTFATSKKHFQKMRKRILDVIQELHDELPNTDSDEIFLFVTDLFHMTP